MRTRRLFASVAGGALAVALLAAPSDLAAQSLMVTGYADFEALITNPDGSGNSNFIFDNHHFNLIFIGNIYKDLFAAAEVEYEHAGEEIKLEYGYLAFTGLPDIRIIAGKFIVPFGRFNKDLHPTIVNKMPDRPHGLKNILPQTYSDAGVWISGARAVGESGVRVVFDAFAVNGLLGDDGGDIRSFRDNDREKRTGDRDDNKAVGGRLGAEFGPQGLDFGASIYHGNYSNDDAVDLDLTLIGADAAFRISGLELRGEIVRASQDATGGDLTKTGGYGQAAYFVTPKFEPVVRYSMRDMPGRDADLRRLSFGLNYYVAAASSVRVAYHLNMEKEGFGTDNNEIMFQWNIML